MLDHYESKVKANLKKTMGMLRRVEAMIEEDRYCVDIAQQVNASIGLLRQVNTFILESHLTTCGGKKLNSKNEKEKNDFVKELIRSFTLTTK